MHVEYDAAGYVISVLFGCTSGSCIEYTGTIPASYASLEDWAENAKIQAYKLDTNGNLVLDSERESTIADQDQTEPLAIGAGGTGADNAEDALNNLGAISTSDVVELIYPVGSIYMSANSADPSTLFQGTSWTQIQDVFLLAAGTTAAGSTGGAATHKHLAPIGRRNYTALALTDKYGTATSQSFTGSKSVLSASSNSTSYSDVVVPYTSAASTMPPYLAVYVWQRTA